MESNGETLRLRQEIERALRRAFDPADLLPRLARLSRLSAPASDDGIFAHRQLAELLVERQPWHAAIYARRALAYCPQDDRAWAVLAFCQTLLGNFRSAATAYRKAIACAPGNSSYAHNLGHLLDVALGEPSRALPWLKRAYLTKFDNSEIVASYVHALARAGQMKDARTILENALERFESRELSALMRWLDQGAPSRSPRRTKPGSTSRRDRLTRTLTKGLAHLPLDSKQRERALALAHDAALPVSATSVDVTAHAAAVAYAIVYVDHVPLSQAEVAAPFRVAVARLRGRFAEIRAKLDLIRGDARYATNRA